MAMGGAHQDAPAQDLECWICRDAATDLDPLVRPCECRGSMAGVHASCVEEWVQRQRRFGGLELPSCPVCRAPYGGKDRRPGPQLLLRQATRNFSRMVCFGALEAFRFVLLGFALVHYGGEAIGESAKDRDDARSAKDSDKGKSAPDGPCVRAVASVALALFLIHKAALLTFSLPTGREPPDGRLRRRLFTSDLWSIARHLAELVAVFVILGARFAFGELKLWHMLPVGLAVLVPILQLISWYPATVWLREVGLFMVFLFCVPREAIIELITLVRIHRGRFMDPLDGPLHLSLTLLAVLVCLAWRSHTEAMALFTVHSCLLALCLLAFARTRVRSPRRDGRAWWSAVMVSVEVVSLSLDRRWFTLIVLLAALRSLQRAAMQPRPPPFYQGPLWWCTLLVFAEGLRLVLCEARGAPERSPTIVWLILLCSAAFVANWRRCVFSYRMWQRRHATFVLCVDSSVGEEAV